MAGYAPHLDSIVLALRGWHAKGDALGWADTDAYQQVIALMKKLARELDEHASRIVVAEE
jgi:hypothetical protein